MALTRITKGVIKPNENYDTHNINSTGIVTAIGLDINGNGDVSGNLSVGGVLTYEDVTSIDSVGIITAQKGIHVGAGVSAVGVGTFGSLDISGDIDVDGHTNLDNVSIAGVTTIADDKKLYLGNDQDLELFYQTTGVPGAYINTGNASGNLTIRNYDAGQYVYIHGDHVHLRSTTGNEAYLRAQRNGSVSLYYDSSTYSTPKLQTTATGVTINGTVVATGADINGDIDVDGHTELDNVNIAGVTTFASSIHVADSIIHLGDTDTKIEFSTNDIRTTVANKLRIHHASNGLNYFNGNNISQATSTHTKLAGSDYVHRFRDEEGDDTLVQFFNTNVKNTILEWNAYGNTTGAGNLIFRDLNSGKTEYARFTGTGSFNIAKDLDVDGHTNLDNVSVAGIITSAVNVHTPYVYMSGVAPGVAFNDTDHENDFTLGLQAGIWKLRDVDAGVDRYQVNSSGQHTLSGNVHVSGGNVTINQDLDVDGHTNLDNVSVAGVTTFSDHINLPVNKQIKFGGNSDFKIEHNTNENYIDSNSGHIYIRANVNDDEGDNIIIQAMSGEDSIKAIHDGAVELYHNGSLRLATTSTGVSFNDLNITNVGFIACDGIKGDADDNTNITFAGNDVITFKAGTTSPALTINTTQVKVEDDQELTIGTGNDLTLWHNQSHSIIKNTTGRLYVLSDDLWFKNQADNSNLARFINGDSVILYYAGNPKLQTVSNGVSVTGKVVASGEIEASQDYPNIRPSLDLNFAATKKLDSRVTYTRSGRASFINEHGLVEIVNSNVPRFDHDPVTRECKGLLIEETRTNLITYSNIAGMSSPNLGGTPQYNDTVNNITLPTGEKGDVRRYLAASGGGGGRWGGYSGNANVPKTGSMWVRTVSGTGSAIIDVSDGGGKTVNLTEEWQRVTTTHTPGNAYEFFDIYFSNPVTIYYWGVQIEEGAFMSSYIPTNNATATRGVETFVIDGENFTEFYNPIESTILVNYTHDFVTSSQLGTEQRVYRFRAVGGLDTRIDYVSNSGYNPYIAKDGSGVASINNGQSTVFGGGANRTAVRVKENSFASSFNGSTSVEDTSGAWNPTNAITEVYLGSSNNGDSPLNGHIQRFTYYPVGFPNSQLVTLTS